MRSWGRTGATVIGPDGATRPARVRSQPAIIVSASGTAKANRPATPRIAKPSARLASEPPNSSGTQASGSPASSSACQSVSFQRSSLARLMVWGSARSARIRAATSATIWLFSPATIGSLVFSLTPIVSTAAVGFSTCAMVGLSETVGKRAPARTCLCLLRCGRTVRLIVKITTGSVVVKIKKDNTRGRWGDLGG